MKGNEWRKGEGEGSEGSTWSIFFNASLCYWSKNDLEAREYFGVICDVRMLCASPFYSPLPSVNLLLQSFCTFSPFTVSFSTNILFPSLQLFSFSEMSVVSLIKNIFFLLQLLTFSRNVTLPDGHQSYSFTSSFTLHLSYLFQEMSVLLSLPDDLINIIADNDDNTYIPLYYTCKTLQTILHPKVLLLSSFILHLHHSWFAIIFHYSYRQMNFVSQRASFRLVVL